MSAPAVAGGWPAGDPDDVVRGILRDPAYERAGVTTNVPAPDPWQPVRQWLQDHVGTPLDHWLRELGRVLEKGSGVGTVLGAAIDIAIVGLVVFLVVRTALAFVKRGARRGAVVAEPLVDVAGSRADWRRRAADAAARGEYAQAIAALFRASLAALDAAALVRFDGARTPGEYRRLVRRASPASAPPFDDLANGFVRATYAPEPPARADYDAAERAFAAFEPALSSS